MNIDNLLALQDEDARIRTLKHELESLLPARRAAANTRLKAAQHAVEIATQENLASEAERLRLTQDYTRQHNALLRAERNAASQKHLRGINAAAKEYQEAKQALAALEAATKRYNDDRTPTERLLDAAREFEANEEDAVRAILADLAARKADVEAELANVTARRDEIAATIPADILAYYRRVMLTRWPVVAPFKHAVRVCTGCNLTQPMSVKQALDTMAKNGNATITTCPNCGRILY